MRIASTVLGLLLFVVGLVLLIAGAGSSYYQSNSLTESDASLPEQQAEITGLLALGVMGAAGMVSGSVFVLIGSNRTPRPAAPAYPQVPQQPYPYPPGPQHA